MDDLESVPVRNRDVAQRRAWDDLEIALDRDLPGIEPKLADHFGDADSRAHAALLAVDPDSKASIENH
jgi:hypothetical protein